jgi:hypothetical protein
MVTTAQKPITAAVRRYVRGLGPLDGQARLSADLAVELAKVIDAGASSTTPRLTAIAVANRELRATLAEIAGNNDQGRQLLADIFGGPR